MQQKMISMTDNDLFFLHLAEFIRQCAAVQIQIISHSLPVEGDGKGSGACFCRFGGEIYKQPATHGFRCGAEDSVGENQIFPDTDGKKILHDRVAAAARLRKGTSQKLKI